MPNRLLRTGSEESRRCGEGLVQTTEKVHYLYKESTHCVSAVLISDSLYKNTAMCRKQIALLLFATKFGPQEVDSLNQLQGYFQSLTVNTMF